jgi:transglutaminase-like putative cysteine protease
MLDRHERDAHIRRKRLCAAVLFLLLAFCSVPLIHVRAQTSGITKVVICSQVNGYEDYVERSSTINLGEVFYVYVGADVPGTVTPNGQDYIKMQFMLDITDPIGMITFSQKSKVIEKYADPQTYSSGWDWWVEVNSSELVNPINGDYQIKAGLTDFEENVNTSAPGSFTLQGGFLGNAVYSIDDAITFANQQPSTSSQVRMVQLIEIPSVGSFQTVLDGPRASIQPQGIAEDAYGNKYMLFGDLTVPPQSSLTIDVTYTVSIKLAKLIAPGTIPFSALQNLPPETQEYLQPTQYIESDNPVFTDTANSYKQTSGDVLQLIYQLDNFTKNHVTYDNAALMDSNLSSQYNKDSALTTYNKGKGVCTNFSRLLVALLRAAGIPARTVSGWGFLNMLPGVTYRDTTPHEWVELYLPGTGWIPVEPQAPNTLGYTLGSHVLVDFSDSERNVNVDGYNYSISSFEYWSEAEMTPSETFSHVTSPSYNGNPTSQYESVTAQMITSANSLTATGSSSETVPWSLGALAFALGFLILSLPFIIVVVAVVLVVRRRKRRSSGAPVAQLGTPLRPTFPPPFAVARPTKYCTACGTQLHSSAAFCVKCGTRQK